jgi:hypothetical protein
MLRSDGLSVHGMCANTVTVTLAWQKITSRQFSIKHMSLSSILIGIGFVSQRHTFADGRFDRVI